jgi:hypothetical protein
MIGISAITIGQYFIIILWNITQMIILSDWIVIFKKFDQKFLKQRMLTIYTLLMSDNVPAPHFCKEPDDSGEKSADDSGEKSDESETEDELIVKPLGIYTCPGNWKRYQKSAVNAAAKSHQVHQQSVYMCEDCCNWKCRDCLQTDCWEERVNDQVFLCNGCYEMNGLRLDIG